MNDEHPFIYTYAIKDVEMTQRIFDTLKAKDSLYQTLIGDTATNMRIKALESQVDGPVVETR